MRSERALGRRGESGFTLIEMLVALFVTVELILAVLLLFDFSNKLTRVQTNVTDMQQSLRVAQYDTVRFIRMLRRGGLPLGPMTAGAADANAAATLNGIGLAVRDNAVAGALIAGAGSPTVVTGSDVLIIRGAFSNPVYQVDSGDPNSLKVNFVGGLAGTGTVTIPATVPSGGSGIVGIPQHLDALIAAVNSGTPEALLLVSPVNDSLYAVVELDPDPTKSNVKTPATGVTIAFKWMGGTRTNNYNALSPGGTYPPALTTVNNVSIVEEYRVYVRSVSNNPPAAAASAADKAAALNPKLSRARVFPNSDDAYGSGTPAANAPSYSTDVADDVTDLQVALGFDSTLGAGLMRQKILSTVGIDDTGDNNDDWLFNSPADIPINNIAIWNAATLYYIRLSTLVRTDRPDPKYTAPAVIGIEDNSYTGSPFNTGKNLLFRRRILQTVVDVRNLG
jgi:hypothetical protein